MRNLELKPGAYLAAASFCKALGISRTTFWRWSHYPNFPRPLRIGRTTRWRADEVVAFLDTAE